MQGAKIYVGNLNYAVTEDQLRGLFSQYGEIKDIVLITDKYTGRSKGFGFVEFSDPSAMKNAIESQNGKEHDGRTLTVNEARQRPERDSRGGGRDNY